MQSIKRQIKSVSSTARVTNAMKLVAASRLRKAKARYEQSSQVLKRISENMQGAFEQAEDMSPGVLFDREREIRTSCYIVITGSMGFCGSYNANVIRRAEELMEKAGSEPVLITIGSKGGEHFSFMGRKPRERRDDAPDAFSYQDAEEMASRLAEEYRNGAIDEIVIVYTTYINSLRQDVIHEKLLPMDIEEHRGAGAWHEIEYQPSPEEVFRYMIRKYLTMKLYNAAVEAATCEYASRRTAMDNATKNANDLLAALRQKYSRARQAAITNEIIEVVSGSEAQNG